jgi:hypothetical protein
VRVDIIFLFSTHIYIMFTSKIITNNHLGNLKRKEAIEEYRKRGTKLRKSNSFSKKMNSKGSKNNYTKPALILSHGNYYGHKKKFKVPDNILLVQYTKSGESLYPIDALHIIEHYRGHYQNIQPFYLRDKKRDFLYRPDGRLEIHDPGEIVDELSLAFESNEYFETISKKLRMGILNPDGTRNFDRISPVTTALLSDVLQYLSLEYKKSYPGKIVPVCQLSCRIAPLDQIDWEVNGKLHITNVPEVEEWAKGYEMNQVILLKYGVSPEFRKHGWSNFMKYKKANYEIITDMRGGKRKTVKKKKKNI